MYGRDLTTGLFQPLLRGTTAMDRWEGLKQVGSSGGSQDWLWWVLAVVGAAVVVGICVAYVTRRKRRRAMWHEFRRRAAKAGLREDETKLLRHMARLVRLKDPNTIFTADSIFDRGAQELLKGPRVAAMDKRMRTGVDMLLGSIRDKLRFPRSSDEPAGFTSSRQIAPGSSLLVIPWGAGGPVAAVLAGVGPKEFIIEMEVPHEARAGDSWTVRHFTSRSAWEFDSPVVRRDGNKVVLAHSQDVRRINFRRFPRSTTNRPAHTAAFSFRGDDSSRKGPMFKSATLVEIAGPGLVFRTSLETTHGSKVLVSVELASGQNIRGLGKVRRIFSDEQGRRLVAVELVGLSPGEVAELARETNLAAAHLRQVQDDEDIDGARERTERVVTSAAPGTTT